jgi:N-acetyl sugar amidotransferase
MMDAVLKRCARCVLPETYPQIKYDVNGVCNVCLDYDQKWSSWKTGGWEETNEKLSKIVSNLRKLRLKYDCLVPFSGGKDSAYVLYVCKNIYKLNVLAFNFNNGFQTEEARRNIYHEIDLLDIDLVTLRPRWGLMKELYKSFLLTGGEACTPCNIGIELGAYRIARQEKIPLIIWGYSPRTEERSPKEIYAYNKKYFLNVIQRNMPKGVISGSIYGDLENNTPFDRSIINRKIYNLSHKFFINMDSLKFAVLFNTPLRLNLPEYIEWNENELFDLLKKKLLWEESRMGKEHMDCEISPVKTYLRYLRWGFSSKTQKYSALVRDKQMDRDTALNLIKDEGNVPEESLNKLFSKLDLNSNHMEKIKKSNHLGLL